VTDLQWLIGGEAGYGIVTTGVMMSKIFTRLGLSVFDYVEYPSLIRGGHNAYYVRGSDNPIFSQRKGIDILVALNKDTINKHKDEVSENGAIIYDPSVTKVEPQEFSPSILRVEVPLLEITKKVGADHLMINTVAIGASLALFYSDFGVLQKILTDVFGKKGEKVIQENLNASKAGFDYVKTHSAPPFKKQVNALKQQNLLISAAEAVALGAIRAGLQFAAIYPMTPINGVMTTIVQNASTYGIVVKEPEDEIAGINMAIGASFAGARSLVATSGGGFSLMVESLGLAAQTEVPLVVVEGMRPGPATGMPTWTEQGDVRFVLHAAQGDFPRIVIAPGDAEEAFGFTMTAFNLAETYQLPVILLVDKYLMESHATVPFENLSSRADSFRIERGKLLRDEDVAVQTDYKRYALVEDGISPRSIPGQKGGIGLAGSDEHDEHGLYSEDAHMRVSMMDKRFKKLDSAIPHIPPPDLYGDEKAPVTIVSFGSTKMPIFEAMSSLAREGIAIRFLKVSYLNPFPTEAVASTMKDSQKTLVIENNKTGQFEGLIREYTGFSVSDHLRKYDGRPFYPEEIVDHVKTLLKK